MSDSFPGSQERGGGDTDIDRMIGGYKKFRKAHFSGDAELFRRLNEGQSPKTLVIACSDSRVDPALLTRSAPGEIFVVRNVANLVPPYEPDTLHHGVSAALEYAVKVLEVENIIVFGHSQCGGIRALMSDGQGEGTEFIETWLAIAEPARRYVREELTQLSPAQQIHACEKASLLLGLENLLTFPWIRERVEAGNLALHAWYFHIGRARLFRYDANREGFFTFK